MKKHLLSLALACFLIVGTLAACVPAADSGVAMQETIDTTTPTDTSTAPDSAAAANGGRTVGPGFTIAVNQETPTMAPGRHGTVHGHWKNIMTHNGLFRVSDDLSPVPDLVADWRALSDVLFEFTLHEGVYFHNGEELTAYDVIASLEFMRQFPEGAGQRTAVISGEVIDRYTFTLYTGEPNSLMLFELAHHANFILPSSLIETGNDFNDNPIGSGPFVFENWNFGDSLTFSRFDNYFDAERTARVEYIHWRIIPEGTSRTIALEAGEVEYVAHVAPPDIPRLEDNPNITVITVPSIRIHYMLFNHTLPMFQNVYVRRAIDMAIDRDSIVLAGFDGWGVPLWQQFPPDLPGASAEGIRGFDPEGARALLAEQGIDPASITFEMIAISEEQRRKAEVVQANLADIGIAATVSQIDLAGWLGQANAAQHDLAISTFTPTNLTGFLRSTLHTNAIGAQNWSFFDNQEFSDLIDQAVATIDVDANLALLYEITTRANEDVLWIPTNMAVEMRAFDSRLIQPEMGANGNMFVNMIHWAE